MSTEAEFTQIQTVEVQRQHLIQLLARLTHSYEPLIASELKLFRDQEIEDIYEAVILKLKRLL